MSSIRNAVHRRNHKERSQPHGREKWGLLEKHKDYALRAKDHKEKQKRLKILKEKAALANPDEFSFRMISTRTINGQRIADRGNKALSTDVVRILKTQDVGYVRVMLQKTRREREKLESEIQISTEGRIVPLKTGTENGADELEDEDEDAERRAKKVVFVNSVDEQNEILNFDDEEKDKETSLVSKRLSRSELEKKCQAEIAARRATRKRAQQHEVRKALLEAVRKKEEKLMLAEQELVLQRAKMSNLVGGINKHGLKFRIRERKR
ncbi:uncharacterized protein PV09_00939 [Verruconis gallopava]|uniref:U3 small nucleolar RNA-associated protein 11 n=1 Tax=Verruconis gallopava TaxID=253628 RepID=A0A0D2AQV1_9PEZI|nr:uncharacterized protein PV09_00939 [Verruconis gallopava]KIW09048.1 hypothetical protein PV09_00939 [Verruconis gallopava]